MFTVLFPISADFDVDDLIIFDPEDVEDREDCGVEYVLNCGSDYVENNDDLVESELQGDDNCGNIEELIAKDADKIGTKYVVTNGGEQYGTNSINLEGNNINL